MSSLISFWDRKIFVFQNVYNLDRISQNLDEIFHKILLTLTIRSTFDRIVNINVIDLDKSFKNDYQNTAIINRIMRIVKRFLSELNGLFWTFLEIFWHALRKKTMTYSVFIVQRF